MVEEKTQNQKSLTGTQPDNNYFGVREIAAELGVSKATVLRWIDAGKLEGFFRIGRKWLIRKSDFEQFINIKVTEEK